MKHTPTPWTTEKVGDGKRWLIYGANGQFVGEITRDDISRAEAEANHDLVLSVNHHEELVEALKAALKSSDHDHIYGDHCGPIGCWVQDASALLAKLDAEPK